MNFEVKQQNLYKDKVTTGNRVAEKMNSLFFPLFSRGSIYSLPDIAPDQSVS